MTSRLRLAALLFCAFLLGACAHPLAIGPDVSRIERPAGAEPIAKSVAYFIAPELRERVVNTPGGGGDTVSYSPYKDLETAFYKMLSNVFREVSRLNSASDKETMAKRSVSLVITPDISTTSSSPSPFTWPPTQFSIIFTCNIADVEGRPVARISARGDGKAEFEEFKSDFSLAGKRAAEDVLRKLQDALLASSDLRKP